MAFVIIPPDNRIGVDGVFRTVAMDLPHINSIRGDDAGARVEYRSHNGDWPEPAQMTAEAFVAQFGPLLEAWAAAPDDVAPDSQEGPQAPPPAAPSADMARLALAVNLANNAIINGVQAGDYRWHGGATDFEWNGQRMDAPGLIEYARTLI